MNFEIEFEKLGFARLALHRLQEKQSARLAIMETAPPTSPQAIAARIAFYRDEPLELKRANKVRALQQKLGAGPWIDPVKVAAALKIDPEGLELEREAMANVKGLSVEDHLKDREPGIGRTKSDGGRDSYIPKWIVRTGLMRRGKRLAD